MSEHKTWTEKPDECDGCGYETADLTEHDAYACTPGHGPFTPEDQKERRWLCKVCEGTMSGNATLYPRNAIYDYATLRSIAYATNMILDAIRGTRP